MNGVEPVVVELPFGLRALYYVRQPPPPLAPPAPLPELPADGSPPWEPPTDADRPF